MKPKPDYYTVLQVDPRAEPEVIQAAYRRLAAKYHPDVDTSPEATERMKLMNTAYAVLSDPVKRREFDMSRSGIQQQTGGETLSRHYNLLFLVLALVVLALLLRFNIRLLLLAAPLFLVLWLLLKQQR